MALPKKFWMKLSVNILGLPVLALAVTILHNNVGNNDYTRNDIQTAYQHSIQWLQQNNHRIQNDHNSMLWWMLLQANAIQPDTQLDNIIQQYKNSQADRYRNSPWSYLITGQQNSNFSIYSLGGMPDYNLHFIYAMNCSRALAREDIIQQQNRSDFCWRQHPVSPACITHQMMGFRFLQRTQCEDPEMVSSGIKTLSRYIEKQSTYDFRVVDVYLQRVLMQLDSGNKNKINPRWIKRILQNQNDDGGWDDFQPLIPVGNNRYFGFTNKGVGIRSTESTFHATAQGVWLMAMLLQDAP